MSGPYRPLFASEKLLPEPYRGCRISSDFHATAIATRGESTLTPSVRTMGLLHRRATLTRGWQAFRKTGDDNGIPDQGDVVAMHRAMFPGLPDPVISTSDDFDEVVEAVKSGKRAISISLRLSAVPPSSPLRRYTDADHQVVLWRFRPGDLMVIDPMHDHSDTYIGHWAPIADVRRAANAMGAVYSERYPVGGWRPCDLLKDRVERCSDELAAMTTKYRSEKGRAESLLRDLAECQGDLEQGAEAGREQVLEALKDWIAEQEAA